MNNLLNKYVWLVETIYKAKRITFEEINERWLGSEISEDVEVLEPLWFRKEIAGIIEKMWNKYSLSL